MVPDSTRFHDLSNKYNHKKKKNQIGQNRLRLWEILLMGQRYIQLIKACAVTEKPLLQSNYIEMTLSCRKIKNRCVYHQPYSFYE